MFLTKCTWNSALNSNKIFVWGVWHWGFVQELLSGGLCPRGVCLEGLCPDTMSYLEHRQKIFHSLNKLEISLVKF